MSQPGQPGGPYPGEPSEPTPGWQQAEPYAPPADPWGTGQQESWGTTPTSTPPGSGGPPGYADQGYGQPGYPPYGEPGYPPAEYGQQNVATPSYGPPPYGQADYGQPDYGRPPYPPTGYGQPGLGHPDHGQPGVGHPDHGQPGYGQPGYGQPGYGQPGYGQPDHAAPGYRAGAEHAGYPGYPPTGGHPYPGQTRDDAGPGAPGVPAPGWAEPAPAGRRAGRPLIALVASLVVLVLGGLIAGYLLFPWERSDSGANTGRGAPAGGPSLSPTPSGAGDSTAAPEPTTDARFVTVGQCLRNEGTEAKPEMTIAPCGPKTYEVLRRFPGATTGERDATTRCSRVSGYTDWYFFNSELDTLDFVLCLKRR